jgi:hypothetical protein
MANHRSAITTDQLEVDLTAGLFLSNLLKEFKILKGLGQGIELNKDTSMSK